MIILPVAIDELVQSSSTSAASGISNKTSDIGATWLTSSAFKQFVFLMKTR